MFKGKPFAVPLTASPSLTHHQLQEAMVDMARAHIAVEVSKVDVLSFPEGTTFSLNLRIDNYPRLGEDTTYYLSYAHTDRDNPITVTEKLVQSLRDQLQYTIREEPELTDA